MSANNKKSKAPMRTTGKSTRQQAQPQRVTLSGRDFGKLIETLDHPFSPNPALVMAIRAAKDQIRRPD